MEPKRRFKPGPAPDSSIHHPAMTRTIRLDGNRRKRVCEREMYRLEAGRAGYLAPPPWRRRCPPIGGRGHCRPRQQRLRERASQSRHEPGAERGSPSRDGATATTTSAVATVPSRRRIEQRSSVTPTSAPRARPQQLHRRAPRYRRLRQQGQRRGHPEPNTLPGARRIPVAAPCPIVVSPAGPQVRRDSGAPLADETLRLSRVPGARA